jgi:hypothetical protein
MILKEPERLLPGSGKHIGQEKKAQPLMSGQSANPAGPGTLNYVEGQVSINGQVVTWLSVGSSQLKEGQVVETANGKAERLLTPGVCFSG